MSQVHSPHSISTHSPSSESSLSPPRDASSELWYPSFFSGVIEFFIRLSSSFLTFLVFGLWEFIAVELSPEFIDVEDLSTTSDEFFDALSHSETLPHIAQALPLPPEVAAAQPLPLVERKYHPWLTGVIVAVYVAIFIVIMGINNCPKHTFPPTECFPYGRFAFQPTDQNPLYGPSQATLIKMGGLYLRMEVWRLFSNIWLHEGLTQLVTDIATLLGVAIPLERKFGFVRVGLLYLVSGLGGSLFSGLFISTGVTVGASGALAGLTAGSLADIIIEYFTLHLQKGYDFLLAITLMLLNIVITIVQHGDNFANIGGTIFGLGFGFVIFSRPPVNRLRCTAVLIVVIIGLLAGMVMLFKGVNLNEHCSWCHYLDCIPFPGWRCKYRKNECEDTEISIGAGTVLSLTCKGNGRTAEFPLVNGKPPDTIEELCYRLCRKL